MKNNMDMKCTFKMKNKKALSTVVSTLLIILLVVVSVAIVWTTVRNFIHNQTEKTKCFDVETGDKVMINDYYTCYRDIGNDGDIDEVQFSIELTDANIDGLVVSMLFGGPSGGESRSFIIPKIADFVVENPTTIYPYPYNPGNPTVRISLPDKNSAKTYVAVGFANGYQYMDWIKIAPIVETNQCGMSDQIYEIQECI